MKTFTNRSVTGLNSVFLSVIAVMVLNSLFLYTAFRNQKADAERVLHSNQVVIEIESVISYAKDAETGMRGYLLTGNKEYLEPYYAGISSSNAAIARLQELVKDNSTQLGHLKSLQTILKSRFEVLEENIEKFQVAGPLSRKGTLNEGKVLMDQARGVVVQMRTEERRLLDMRRDDAEKSQIYVLMSLIGSGLLNVILAAIAYYIIRRRQVILNIEAQARERELALKNRIAQLSQLVAQDFDAATLSKKLLSFISDELHIPAATMYVHRGDSLESCAHYARVTDTLLTAPLTQVPLNVGLVGEAYNKTEIVEINNLPENYFWIGSSLGKSQPTTLVLVPLISLGKPVGVMELALFDKLTEHQLNFLEQCSELVATGLASSESRGHLENLLDTTQLQAQELQTQQEELRSANEDLEEQARMLEKQQDVVNTRNNELEKINQYKSDFLAKMSHELRTPLNSLLILSTLLRENKEGNLSEQQKNFAGTIYDAGNDLLNLINDILDLSKIEARKLVIRSERFSLKSMTEQLLSTFKPQAEKKGLDIRVSLDRDAEDLILETDGQRLGQILRNFMSNAVKFTETGSVEIKGHNFKNGMIDISVKDTGIGINPEQRATIFEAFEQGNNQISRKYGGTGLGLTISKELAELLGGHIVVHSEEGKGSEFTIRLPIVLPSEIVPAAKSSIDINISKGTGFQQEVRPPAADEVENILKTIHGDKRTLLIVEDDERFSGLVAQAARDHEFMPIQVTSGETALQLLERFTPTAIMLDIKLPGVSGFGVLETLKKIPQLRHVPVHMISALDYPQQTLRMGAMGYLGKPVTMDQIHSAVEQLKNIAAESTKKLLIVEDNKVQREAIAALLQGPDVELTSVETGEEALKEVLSKTFDCLVLDLSLPDMTGNDFLEKLHKLDHPIPPVIVYTAKQVSKREEEYLRKYSESIILKGARSPERLLDEVSLFLHRVSDTLPMQQQQMLSGLQGENDHFDGRKLLIVDDDMRNIFALTHVLESKGFKVDAARDGQEALEMAQKDCTYDAILMDLMMPRMDGFESMERIRSLQDHTETPIIALTAKAMKGDHEKALSAGANDYLSKPINIGNLFSVLRVWLRERDVF
ncbi:response regulator [Bdellovibrio sp. SKB1291214]|uniref:response regulator n=1 Tax=Bdellovibrio sp. SKB1291214 TaxID=1732569 RepID=UPI000B51B780|nr:response regulator [Bdellovibrio sp. SKB1291214]UYL07371.1 response regulator [Bdellovibrio sp. SKB1291214]